MTALHERDTDNMERLGGNPVAFDQDDLVRILVGAA
jgi:hypothetical protein